MQEKATSLGVSLRPHIKTHKCLEIAKRQIEAGAKGITVSTFYEAELFVRNGFNDILWAFPLPLIYIDLVLELVKQATIRVTIDNELAFKALINSYKEKEKKLPVWVEIDVGEHRSGIQFDSEIIIELVSKIAESPFLYFDGILTHGGHSYRSRSREELISAAIDERDRMLELAHRIYKTGIKNFNISIGSTPSMSVATDLLGITEIRPGNYVFNDFTQVVLGSCSLNECALTVLSSIISHQDNAQHFIIDAGALALSKDIGPLYLHPNSYGLIYKNYRNKILRDNVTISNLSQELGIVKFLENEELENRFQIGEKIRILENHSCLTAAQFDYYYVVLGDEIVDKWKIHRGRY
jgi:D-serine deaminase-like pyridoxal phosphate-dependent protein